jgi:GDPmannose 4,6-dehydratase
MTVYKKKAIIVGSAGQDGFYLSKLLSYKKYTLIKIDRNNITNQGIKKPFNILNRSLVKELIKSQKPQEIYYLAAHHHSSNEKIISLSNLFKNSHEVHCKGLINFLVAISENSPQSRLFYAASSLIFGEPKNYPQNEKTTINPICFYGITKATGIELCNFFRRERNVFCSAGILYNHESPLRAEKFVSQKIIKAACEATKYSNTKLTIGNLDTKVDWSYAGDFVLAFNSILQLKKPTNFIISSGKLHTVRDFARIAFNYVGLNYKRFVIEDSKILQRTVRKIPLVGDNKKLRSLTNWSPLISFEELIKIMIKSKKK